MVEECKVVVSNAGKRTIRVERPAQGGMLSAEIPIFKGVDLPQVGSFVVCIFNGSSGYVIGELE